MFNKHERSIRMFFVWMGFGVWGMSLVFPGFSEAQMPRPILQDRSGVISKDGSNYKLALTKSKPEMAPNKRKRIIQKKQIPPPAPKKGSPIIVDRFEKPLNLQELAMQEELRTKGSLSWHQRFPADDGGADGCNSSQFKCVMGGEAVLDMETGLVWQRTPADSKDTFHFSRVDCWNAQTGGRMGWRLPSFSELQSLVDPFKKNLGANRSIRTLPTGHPFSGIQEGKYWSSTTTSHLEVEKVSDKYSNVVPSTRVAISFRYGQYYFLYPIAKTKIPKGHAWCVRGQPAPEW